MSTQKTDVVFVPKVWSDHIQAYFDRKMGIGQLAVMDKTLVAAPGETVSFPYFKKIGAAQEPAESEGLSVDALQDDSFSCTVKEVGKAVGWKNAALRKSAASKQDHSAEAQRQIGQVFAEKVDVDLVALLSDSANYEVGYTAAGSSDKLTISTMLDLKIGAFGDKHDQAVAIAMHSLSFATLMKDGTAGFLKMDANDPFYKAPGFQGRILGQAIFTLDSMPRVADVASKKTYAAFSFKPNPFGIYMAQDLMPESDRDILHRENIVSATMWYGVLGLHAKVSADDKRIARGTFCSEVAA